MNILKAIAQTKECKWFRYLVGGEAPGYYERIKKPIDLQTMQKKLKTREYPHVEAVSTDMELLLKNSIDYNGSDHLVTEEARKVLEVYRGKLENLPNGRNRIGDYHNNRRAASDQRNSRAAYDTGDEKRSKVVAHHGLPLASATCSTSPSID